MLRTLILLLALAIGALLWQARPGTAPPAPIGLVGDSITQLGETASDTGALLGRPIINAGHSGSSTADWLPDAPTGYLPAAIASFRAAGVRTVQVALGTNDAIHLHAAPHAYARRLSAICAALRRAGFRVVLALPPALDPARVADAVLLGAYWPTVPAVARSRGAVMGETGAPAYFAAHPDRLRDGIHPGPAGQAALARLWAAGLAGA